jgi:hypothetical protein
MVTTGWDASRSSPSARRGRDDPPPGRLFPSSSSHWETVPVRTPFLIVSLSLNADYLAALRTACPLPPVPDATDR